MKLRSIAVLCASLTFALGACVSGAAAGGGNGGGHGGGDSHGQSQSGDNHSSGDHQGQSGDSHQSSDNHQSRDNHQSDGSHDSKQSSTSASQPATGGDNSKGVKPSNTTDHDTYAKASSDQTKQYGNGKTAGQIATQSGHGDATLHGPGNSQPHKTAACPGGHEVDVHALKHKSGKCASSEQSNDSGVAAVVKTETKTKKPCKKGDTSSQQASNDEHKSTDNNGAVAGVVVVKTHTKKPCKKKSEQAQVKAEEKTDVTQHVVAELPKVPCPIRADHEHGSKGDDNDNDEKSGDEMAAKCAPAAPAVAAPAPVAPAPVATAAVVVSQPATPVAPAVTPAPVATPAPAATPAPVAAPAPAATASGTVGASTPATATPAAASGVKGAVVALQPTTAKPSGGVLGATTRLGGTVGSTTLPFTGLPLWIFALVAAGLIVVGVAFRRASADRL